MKITGIKIYYHTVPHVVASYGDRVTGPLDIYEEYNQDQRRRDIPMDLSNKNGNLKGAFLVINTDEGVSGIHGPVEYRAQSLLILEGLNNHLIGRDPMENRLIWDIISRYDRHSRSSIMMMAISAVDIALWDLKGKILNLPVYKLLGGGRNRIRPYASMLGAPTKDIEAARESAIQTKEMGFGAQKWFFRHGPGDGVKGIRKNLELAFMLREELGEDYELMFDCWMGWTIPYALTVFRELTDIHPSWVEEVLRPHMFEGYKRLKANTDIPLSSGEHLYLRSEALMYLQEGLFDVMQADPEWCGGISEALRIAEFCETFGTPFIPHGMSLMPALHVIASMPMDVCPYAEFLIHYMQNYKEPFFDRSWLDEDGWITLRNQPGLDENLDLERITHTEEITAFTLKK